MQPEKIDPAPGVPRSRGGRPSAERAGDVDRRILEAATALFLQQGFEATSCEQVAVQAVAGKASIYARYANKEALFEAVVRDHVQRSMAPTGANIAPLATARERLRAAGEDLLVNSLRPDVIAMMRAVITTVYRMPQLARLATGIGRDRCVLQVARAIVGPACENPESIESAMSLAGKFVDLVVAPHQMRALLGEETAGLLEDARRGLDESIVLLSDGGWLDDWQ